MSIGKVPAGPGVAGNVPPPRKPPSGGAVAGGGGEFDPNDPIEPNQQPEGVRKRRTDEISEESQEVRDAVIAIMMQPVLAQVNWLYDGNLIHLGSFETPKLENIRDYLRTNMDEAVRAGLATYSGGFGSNDNPEERRRRNLEAILEQVEKLLKEREEKKSDK